MKTTMLIIICVLLSASNANELKENDTNPVELKQEIRGCFDTILSAHREIFFNFCFESNNKISIVEYSNKAKGRKSPYVCLSKGEYEKDKETTHVKLQIFDGQCNKNRKFKAANLSCEPARENEYACEFLNNTGKKYRFRPAFKTQLVNKELCENDKNYLAKNEMSCANNFGMESGVNLYNQRRSSIRMRAETRHNTN